ncbi:MAG: hypothetical protein MJ118_05330, partial [Clostridia bacterium]|nr:hypothetical protein [Clostridia bacterium]
MKKAIAFILVLAMAASLTACRNRENTTGTPNPMKEITSLEDLREAADCAMIKPEGVEVADEV